MNHSCSLFVVLCLATVATAQTNRPAGVTTLMLGVDVANGIVVAAPGSRVRVPPLERLQLLVPDGWPYPIQWTKNNKPIAGATGRFYLIPLATTADSGLYNIIGLPFPHIGTGISLEVVPSGHLGNFSTLLELAPGATTQIIGFVVSGTSGKSLLGRAVGPSLRPLGIAKPVAQPRLRFFDSFGKEIGFTRPAVVVDMPAFFASVGAFPLTGGESSFEYGRFAPGNYTIHVSDQSGQGGTVLVEVYEYSTGPEPPTPVAPPSPGG